MDLFEAGCPRFEGDLELAWDTIVIIPSFGFEHGYHQRYKDIKCLMYIEYERVVKNQHAANGGEVPFGKYNVDGYDKEKDKSYIFLGCYWHSHPECYPNLRRETIDDVETMPKRFERTLRKESIWNK